MDEIKQRINSSCNYNAFPCHPDIQVVRHGEGYRAEMRFRNAKSQVFKRFNSAVVDTRDMVALEPAYVAMWQEAVSYFSK